jgi:hypothetical protein
MTRSFVICTHEVQKGKVEGKINARERDKKFVRDFVLNIWSEETLERSRRTAVDSIKGKRD